MPSEGEVLAVPLIELTPKELRALHVVHIMGPMPLDELEEKFHEPHQELLDSLVEKGLLRIIPDQGYFTVEHLAPFSGAGIFRGFMLVRDPQIGWQTFYLDGTVRESTDIEIALWLELKESLG